MEWFSHICSQSYLSYISWTFSEKTLKTNQKQQQKKLLCNLYQLNALGRIFVLTLKSNISKILLLDHNWQIKKEVPFLRIEIILESTNRNNVYSMLIDRNNKKLKKTQVDCDKEEIIQQQLSMKLWTTKREKKKTHNKWTTKK